MFWFRRKHFRGPSGVRSSSVNYLVVVDEEMETNRGRGPEGPGTVSVFWS